MHHTDDVSAQGPAPGADEPASTEALMEEAASRIRALEAEVAELKDKWLRAEAETQNVRARARREVEDARNFAVQRFAREVVEVAETLERALAALPAPAEGEAEVLAKMREGIEATQRMFLAVLERNGVVRVEAQGAKFDPELHQAMAEAPSPVIPAGHVAQAWTPGWTLNGRLLKPAMVVVSTGGAGPAAPAAEMPSAGTVDTTA
ncbi:nucleotide exchange factor GrpE [Elioraea sp.]|jgi:molecular chaperone GrpE|uniref:nucleotide exchange factor GrpE n=1 Tax=Elioraea sp. TaxID=2185103 RepID=UPI00307F8DEB